MAEETDLIVSLGAWAIRESCAQLARWQRRGLALDISVNLSVRQFFAGDLVELICHTLKESGIDASFLALELIESLLIEDAELAIDMLQKLADLGAKTSIDDFGAGYSSLSYLKRFSFHELKIDRSFMNGVTHNRQDKALVSSVIYLAHEFDLRVVAEGVENEEQLEFLRKAHCDLYQGFYFSRPMSADDLAPLLVDARKLAPS